MVVSDLASSRSEWKKAVGAVGNERMAHFRKGMRHSRFMSISRELFAALRSECFRLMREEPIDRHALMAVARFYFELLDRVAQVERGLGQLRPAREATGVVGATTPET